MRYTHQTHQFGAIMDSKKAFEKCFPDFINDEQMHIVWQHAWEASRKVALEECKAKIRKIYERND